MREEPPCQACCVFLPFPLPFFSFFPFFPAASPTIKPRCCEYPNRLILPQRRPVCSAYSWRGPISETGRGENRQKDFFVRQG